MKHSVIIGPNDHEAVLDVSLALFTKVTADQWYQTYKIQNALYSLDCFPAMLDFKYQSHNES